MSKKATIIGLDIGNGFVKLVHDGEVPLCYYNTVKEVTNAKLNSMLMYSPYPTFTYDGKKYQIGFPSTYGSGGISSTRYRELEFKREALFAISQIVKEPNEVFKVVTGVPAYHIESDGIAESIKKNLEGKHEVLVDDQKVNFIIESVSVLSQGMAAMVARCFEWDAKKQQIYQIVSDDYIMKRYLIQEIGWGTTEFFVIDLQAGGVIKYDTLPKGMKEVVSQCMDEINRKYPQLRVKDFYESYYQLDDALRSGVLDLGSKKVPIGDILKDVKLQFANEVKLWARNSGFKLESYHRIILSGGGGTSTKDAFTEVYKPTLVELMDDAQMANATGYKVWGAQNLCEVNFRDFV